MADQLWFMTRIREEEEDGSHDPINSVTALQDDGQSNTSGANPTMLSLLEGKEKDVSKTFLMST